MAENRGGGSAVGVVEVESVVQVVLGRACPRCMRLEDRGLTVLLIVCRCETTENGRSESTLE